MIVNYKKLNPLGFHLLKLLQDPTIRQIILVGGSSSGKTFGAAEIFLILLMIEGENMLVMRKVGASIKDSIYTSFKSAAEHLNMTRYFDFKDGIKVIRCLLNGAKIVFKGLDNAEKIKGIDKFKRVFMDELNEYDEGDYKQMRKRLRGMEGQQLVSALNPVKQTCWVKKNLIDKEQWHDVPMTVEIGGKILPPELTEVKSIRMNAPRLLTHERTGEVIEHPSDMVVIQTTYLNNFWVVGSPDGTYGYYDEQCIADYEKDRINDPDYYNVYALGEWGVIRTGSEFFGSFNRGMHTKDVRYNPDLSIHISVDSNVLPYITCTFWQVDTSNGCEVRQIDEVCAESPNNTVRKSSKLVAKRLKELNPENVYIHGDASTRATNNIDDEKRSFLDLFIDTLKKEGVDVVDCVSNKNPSVPMSGEFINAIFDGTLPGLSIVIGKNCSMSIEDYLSVQKDVNGAILKMKVKNKITMQTYEEHGHISDTFRYLCVDVLREQFLSFSNRRKRNLYARDGVIGFYNPATECRYRADLLYLLPNINGKMAMIRGRLCGNKWHIVGAWLEETVSVEYIYNSVVYENAAVSIVECSEDYYPLVRKLRDVLPEVRARKEESDYNKRATATSDLVRDMVLFNPELVETNEYYRAFVTNLLDYGRDKENIEASAVISGFIQYAIKSM